MKIRVFVKPNSKKAPLVVKKSDEIGEIWEIFVREPAIDGRANLAVREILAQEFGVAKTRVRLVGGAKSRIKIFEIAEN